MAAEDGLGFSANLLAMVSHRERNAQAEGAVGAAVSLYKIFGYGATSISPEEEGKIDSIIASVNSEFAQRSLRNLVSGARSLNSSLEIYRNKDLWRDFDPVGLNVEDVDAGFAAVVFDTAQSLKFRCTDGDDAEELVQAAKYWSAVRWFNRAHKVYMATREVFDHAEPKFGKGYEDLRDDLVIATKGMRFRWTSGVQVMEIGEEQNQKGIIDGKLSAEEVLIGQIANTLPPVYAGTLYNLLSAIKSVPDNVVALLARLKQFALAEDSETPETGEDIDESFVPVHHSPTRVIYDHHGRRIVVGS